MRFPRFHFGTAIAMGLSMLCMSSVPVFADGIGAPTLSAAVSGSTVSLSWNVTSGTNHFMVRRDTAAAPANTSAGTLVVTTADTTTTSYQDAGLVDGTYYYSVFAINGGTTSPPGSAGPLTVVAPVAGGDGGVPGWLRELRRQNGLDQWGYSLSSSSSSISATSSSSSEVAAPIVDAPPLATSSSAASPETSVSSLSSSSSAPQQQKTAVSLLQQHTCARVMKWFANDPRIFARVNVRLQKMFGFTCGG